MTEVIVLESKEWRTLAPVPVHVPVRRRLQFAGSQIVFDVLGGRYIDDGDRVCYKLTVAAEPNISISQMSYRVEYRVILDEGRKNGVEETGVFTEATATSRDLFVDIRMRDEDTLFIKLTLKKLALNQFSCAVNSDMKIYMERGPTVTLVGSDGSVMVPKRLLKMRSETFEAMFKYDSQENRTGQIQMEQFNTKTLAALKQFLMNCKIEDGRETALGLVLLGDKYDIQALKKAAEDFVKENFHEMDKEDVLDIFSRVSRMALVDAMTDSWKK